MELPVALMQISVSAATTGPPSIIWRKYLTPGTCVHLPCRRHLSGEAGGSAGMVRQPEPRTGWLDNRNLITLLPAGP